MIESKATRNSNIEFLRLVAMFFIVAGHYLSYSGLIETVTGVNQVFAYLIGSGARIAVSLFLMIGIWYMIDREFSARKLLKLYFEIWFYGVAITIGAAIMGVPVSKYGILRVIFPFTLNSVWFGTAYISLLMASPFLRKMFEWDRWVIRNFIIVLSIIIVPKTSISGFNDTWLDVMLWFIYMYLLVGYYKKYLYNTIKAKGYLLAIGGGYLYILMAIGKMICFNIQETNRLFYYGYKLFSLWIIDYKQVPNLICAFCFFHFAISLKPRNNRLINWLAGGTFAMYIVHQVPPMESYLWTDLLPCSAWSDSKYFIIYSLIVILGIGLGATVIDHARRKWVEAYWVKTRLFGMIEEKMNQIFSNVSVT